MVIWSTAASREAVQIKIVMLPPGLLYEEQRLQALHRYAILDTLPESEYDDIVQLAAQLCGVPIALISLVDRDRQWFKANVGLPGVSETERCVSFCTFAIEREHVLVVEDATQDARFAASPLVAGAPFIRFYAGAPIQSDDGFILGTLCVIDREPRVLGEQQRRNLLALKRQVELLLRLRLRVKQTEARNRQLLESSGDAVFLLDEAGRSSSSTPWPSGCWGAAPPSCSAPPSSRSRRRTSASRCASHSSPCSRGAPCAWRIRGCAPRGASASRWTSPPRSRRWAPRGACCSWGMT